MAYETKRHDVTGAGTRGFGGKRHFYLLDSATETFATVEADGYFDSVAGQFETGDTISVYSPGQASTFTNPVREYFVTATSADVALSDPLNVIREKHTLTAAEILALNAAAQVVTTLPGAGKVQQFLGAGLHKPATTAGYGGVAAGENLVFRQTNASGAILSHEIETTGFVDQATAQSRFAFPTNYLAATNALDLTVNQGIALHLLVGELATGGDDPTLIVETFYRIWTPATS